MGSLIPKTFNGTAFAIVLGGWIFSVCLHEFFHALAAYIGGDKSVRQKGYLTFNPIRYADPTLSLVYPVIFLLIGGVGLPGARVYINSAALGRFWDAVVSLAGPLGNALLLMAMMVPLWLGHADPQAQPVFWAAYAFLAYCQITAVIFNLLPIPPLDGFGVVGAVLPWKLRSKLYGHSQLLFLVLLVVMYRVPAANKAYFDLVGYLLLRLKLPSKLVFRGLGMIRFNVLGGR